MKKSQLVDTYKVFSACNVLARVGILLMLFANANTAFSQGSVVADYKKVPIPPSPNAAALGKFGDIPVSPSTGIPNISIPIYGYSDSHKELDINISLQYHAGGHKVEDMASNVGFGWALNAGGVIMRTVKGLPDDMSYGYLKTPALPLLNTINFDIIFTDPITNPPINQGVCMGNSSDFYTVKNIAENSYDGEADIFNLSVGGINEKFFFDKNGTPVFVSPNNLRLEYTWGTGGNFIAKFLLTDSRGVQYHFDVAEFTQSDNAFEPSVPAPSLYRSSWYLSKIVSADLKDEILLSYQSTSLLSYESGLSISYKTLQNGNGGSEIAQSYFSTHTYDAQRISKITLPDKTVVDFLYNHNRLDYVGDKALSSIVISSVNAEKKISLSYDYFDSDNCNQSGLPCSYPASPNNYQKRLKLLAVQEESGVNVVPPYSFEYNNTNLPFRNSKYQDWWGYFNGGSTGSILDNVPSFAILGYDRIPSLSHCKAWILEKINYPTGGNTQFTYELNEGVSGTEVKPIGGLRVQKKEDFDPQTNQTYTTLYTYTKPDNTTSGLLITIPSYTAYWNAVGVFDLNNIMLGKDIYYNESLNPTQTLSYFNGSPVIYTRIKEEQFANGVNNGYKIYEFSPGTTDQMHDYIYPFVQKQDLGWARGLMLKMEVLNSSGTILQSEENEYEIIYDAPSDNDATTRNLVTGNYYWDNLGTPNRFLYGARYYYLVKGKSQLSKTIKKTYESADKLTETITEYTYDNTHHVLLSTKSNDSKGRTLETKNYYPFHYNATIYPLMGQLVQGNRLSEVVSTENWITENGNASVKSILVNDYTIVNSNLLKKTKVSSLKTSQTIPQATIGVFNSDVMYRSSQIDEDVIIEEFDTRGRAVQFKLDGGDRYSVIWGDDNAAPIATANNAEFDDVAFTSFETEEKGNWTFSGSPTEKDDSPTGKYIYRASEGISKSINAGKQYKLSLWRKGSISVSNSTLYHVGETIDNWTYEEYLVENTNVLAITGSGYIDEVRLFPTTSQMTSYTYHSPGKVEEQSDKNGVIVRYVYDTLGRLISIKDEDKNLIQSIDYHYKTTGQ